MYEAVLNILRVKSTHGRIRTLNLLIRSQVLYPVELRVRFSIGIANIRGFRILANFI